MDAFTEEGALLADTYGLRLLRYLTSADDDKLVGRLAGKTTLDKRSESVLPPLIAIAKGAAAAASAPQAAPIRYQLDALGRFQESLGTSVGTALRLSAGGTVAVPIPGDPVAAALAHLLRDVFPLMLLPDDASAPGHLSLMSAIFSHPQRHAFEAAVSSDRDLSKLFHPALSGSSGSLPVIFRSTGAGGTTQLELLPDLLLGAAWTRARASGRDDITSVAAALDEVLALVRRAARGEACEVRVLVGFAGLLPDGVDRVDLPYGTLRPVAPHERELAPRALEGTVSHTVAEGDTVVASYSGDLVLDTSAPYRLLVSETRGTDAPPEWPVGLRGFDHLQSKIDATQLAALLAGTSRAPLTLVPTWRLTFDPLSFGPMLGWSDARTLPSLAPRRLSPAMAKELAQLATAVHTQRRPDFEVAIRRTISGLTSRGDPDDALVDLVIAWENLFGSSQGELRFRISAAIAWVLGSDAVERANVQDQAAKVYDRRSSILHGSLPTPQQVQESLETAREISLRLLRVLLVERSDVLALSSGSARSRAVILGQS
jgi:hypothetical protein